MEDKIRAAETFLDGGTDFHTPLNEALRLIQEDGFENADIVFITDGECDLSENYIEELRTAQSRETLHCDRCTAGSGRFRHGFQPYKLSARISTEPANDRRAGRTRPYRQQSIPTT